MSLYIKVKAGSGERGKYLWWRDLRVYIYIKTDKCSTERGFTRRGYGRTVELTLVYTRKPCV